MFFIYIDLHCNVYKHYKKQIKRNFRHLSDSIAKKLFFSREIKTVEINRKPF